MSSHCICRPGDPEGWYREDCPTHGREAQEARQAECAPGFHLLDYVAGDGYWTSCAVCGKRWAADES